jgi:hypothetical protein
LNRHRELEDRETRRPPPMTNPACVVVGLLRSCRGGLAGRAACEESLSGQDCQPVGDQLLTGRLSLSPSRCVPRTALSAPGATVRIHSSGSPYTLVRVALNRGCFSALNRRVGFRRCALPRVMSHLALRNKARCISYMRQEDNIYNNRVYRDKCHNNQSNYYIAEDLQK